MSFVPNKDRGGPFVYQRDSTKAAPPSGYKEITQPGHSQRTVIADILRALRNQYDCEHLYHHIHACRVNGFQLSVSDGNMVFTFRDGTTGEETTYTTQLQDADLAAIAALTGTGILVRTGTDTWALRTITAGTGIDVNNGDGVSGNPEIVLENTAVTPGSYTHASITVDQQGRLTAASSGAAGNVTETDENDTDNVLMRSDGTSGRTIQDSTVTLDDSGNIDSVASLDIGAAKGSSEDGKISVAGSDYSAVLMVHDIGTGFDAINNLHKHSLTAPSILALSRSKSSDSSHGAVADDDEFARVIGLGWTGSTNRYMRGVEMRMIADGTVSDGVLPSRLEIYTANSSGDLTLALTIDSSQVVALANALPIASGGTGATDNTTALTNLGIPRAIRSSGQDVASTTLASSGMAPTLETGWYDFEAYLLVSCATDGDPDGGFKFDLGDGTATIGNLSYVPSVVTATGTAGENILSAQVTSKTTVVAVVSSGGFTTQIVKIIGSLQCTGAGTFGLRHAMANGTATGGKGDTGARMETLSWLRLTKHP